MLYKKSYRKKQAFVGILNYNINLRPALLINGTVTSLLSPKWATKQFLCKITTGQTRLELHIFYRLILHAIYELKLIEITLQQITIWQIQSNTSYRSGIPQIFIFNKL